MIKKIFSALMHLFLRIFLLLWGVTVIFPLVWMVYSSFKNNTEFYASPWSLPSVIRIENYVAAWVDSSFSRFFFNSFIVVLGSVCLFFIMATTTSYILSKYKFRGIGLVRNFYIAAMMIPGILLLVPQYFQLLKINFTDNLFVLILLYAVGGVPAAVFILTGFMKNINNSFIEAALVDGATEWQIFKNIIIPFTKPAIFFVCLGNIMGSWNDYTTALTFIKEERFYTVPIGLAYLTNSMAYHADYGPMFAGLVLSMAPILILYAIFQKHLLRGEVSSDGIKG